MIALRLPWLSFFSIGKLFAGVICLVLQISLIGWLPAMIWLVYALSEYNTDKKIAKALGSRRALYLRAHQGH
ncbi:MAG: YqaE/Pmp3 family membrane protein [Comamonas sp.]